MIRTMFECAITTQWIFQAPGAAEALLNRQNSERGRVLENPPALGIASLTEESTAEARRHLAEAQNFETKASVTFKAICDDLTPAGTSAYAHYQMMCNASHASDFLIDRYFAYSDNTPGLARRRQPEKMSRDGWAGIVTACLVWAGQAVVYGDVENAREHEIQTLQAGLVFLGS